MCTKVFVQDCNNTNIVVNERVLTQMIEIYKCESSEFVFNTKIGTIQIDMCQKVGFGAEIRICLKLMLVVKVGGGGGGGGGDDDDVVIVCYCCCSLFCICV